MKRMQRLLVPTVLATLILAACGGKDPAELVASARGYADKGEHQAAIIELKTAIQAAPDNGEARFLLGRSLLANGDTNGANLELRKAMDLRYDEDQVVPALARAMMQQGDFQRLLEQFGSHELKDPLAQAELKVTLARANGGLGRRNESKQALQAALKAMPEYGPAKIYGARIQADEGDLDGGLATVETQLQRTPQDSEGWLVKGDLLLYGKHDADAALIAYRQALTVRSTLVSAHIGAMTAAMAKGELPTTKTQLEVMSKALPKHPQTLFFAAHVAQLEKNFDRAKELVDQLLRVSPDNVQVLRLAGTVEWERKSWVIAETHLAKALQLRPALDEVRRMLASVQLQRGEPAKALATLQPLLEGNRPRATDFSLKAQAHMQAGDLEQAERALAQAAKAEPDNVRVRTALAFSRSLQGRDVGGLNELQQLAQADNTVADLPLISALLRKKDYKGALAAVDALERKTPDKPVAANLRGKILVRTGDMKGATAAFQQALKLQPSFYPAAAALAELALMDKRSDDALKILEDFLKASPTNTQALLATATLKVRAGAARDEVRAIFDRAIQQAPTEPAPRLALVNYLLSTQDVKTALSTAQQASAALPENAAILDALGRAQAASGDTNQALASFGKLSQLLPTSVAPHLRIADVHWAAKNTDAAIQALKRALSVDSQSLQAQRSLVDAYLATDKPADATKVAQQVRQQRPQQDVGYLLEGGIASNQRQWPQAISVYRDGLKAVPDSTELATRLHVALTAGKQEAEAGKLAADWLRGHPNDGAFRFYLGDQALARKDLATAEVHYRDVLKIQPENALALNNVAWLMATAKKRGAVPMAEKAVALLPDRPVIMDTLALALAAEGQTAKAVDVMKQAVRLEEKNPQLRFNLAKLLVEAGDKTAAKTELETLAKLGDKFPRHGEVTTMLKAL
ncbi:MAG: PEP-CTERM system TPR-repeat protein PrsT [Burkholderiaceae bacterium]|nr:PEP-CTERM system TPR-repeat protein PrsT [Burkholderiaceae bacterium]